MDQIDYLGFPFYKNNAAVADTFDAMLSGMIDETVLTAYYDTYMPAKACHDLLTRRKKQSLASVTGVILAGGQSSRMGHCKATLPLMGKTLLEWQAEKLTALGVDEVLISGPAELELPVTRTVPDIYPQRGPLSGLHACLSAAQNSICLVVTVDMPLTPPLTLSQLCKQHNGGVTMLVHGGKWEPLCAVYDSALATLIPPLIRRGGAPVVGTGSY